MYPSLSVYNENEGPRPTSVRGSGKKNSPLRSPLQALMSPNSNVAACSNASATKFNFKPNTTLKQQTKKLSTSTIISLYNKMVRAQDSEDAHTVAYLGHVWLKLSDNDSPITFSSLTAKLANISNESFSKDEQLMMTLSQISTTTLTSAEKAETHGPTFSEFVQAYKSVIISMQVSVASRRVAKS